MVKYFSIFSIITIPIFTYLFATKASPFDYTFSMIWNKLWHRLSFILRWTLTWMMLTFQILRLYIIKSFQNKQARKLLLRSLFFLVLTVVIPAMENLPILKKLHALLAAAFAISLMVSLYLFVKHLQKSKKRIYDRSILVFLITIFWSLTSLFIFGNTWVFELFFFQP